MFKKKDLQVGQLVKLRDGSYRMVMPVGHKGTLVLLGENGVWDYINRWNVELRGVSFGICEADDIRARDIDIMAVYGFIEGTINYGRMGYLEPTYRKLIWEREEIPYIIAVDFDGTLCENKWPNIGDPNYEIIDYIKYKQAFFESKLILWTCREGKRLDEAIAWCKKHNLKFDAVNENLKSSIEYFGEDTRKIYATEYIDDKNCTKFKLPFKAD